MTEHTMVEQLRWLAGGEGGQYMNKVADRIEALEVSHRAMLDALQDLSFSFARGAGRPSERLLRHAETAMTEARKL